MPDPAKTPPRVVMNRRGFAKMSCASIAVAMTTRFSAAEQSAERIETVLGSQRADEMGLVLPHEHVLVDFVGADQVSRDRYQPAAVIERVAPFLNQLRAAGGNTLMDCTPAYLGRDPQLLKKLAESSGLQIVTNTGYYAAAQGKYLPAHAHMESADQLAARWTAEWQEGIEGTGIRPGFIKIGLDAGELPEVGRKLVQAAARTHLATGMTIAAHTGDGHAAEQQLEILRAEGVSPKAWIWVHAQNEPNIALHRKAAEAGAWVEFDGIGPQSIEQHVKLVSQMRGSNLLGRTLISQDAGWYWVGEPNGGTFRPYDTLLTTFLPALRESGLDEQELRQLTVRNPAQAFAIEKRPA